MQDDQETQKLPPEPNAPRISGSSTDSKARAFGPYQLQQRVGRGGMGEVWEALQTEPVRRRVAVKLIRAGLDSKEMVARFEAERQALALMNHPAIAKVFDGGTTEAGTPYLVMEFVDGVPLTRFCKEHDLTTEQRLRLFVDICRGVQHAHQKAIIHRDLKPSNILVSMVDGNPQPKIIDFGVARAMAQPLTDRTLFTQLGQLVGTPQYMSPEQATQSAEGIDTRTDVYSLGVILYELLCGARPFDLADLRSTSIDEVRRRIREYEPTRPSTRVRELSESGELETFGEPSTLASQLKGDLDWVTMRALEKEPERRYASPSDLADDIVRHLQNEPVLAGPPSGLYRLEKFVRRHRAVTTASTLVVLAVAVGVAGLIAGLLRARSAERAALREATKANRVTDFMVELFEQSDPDIAQGRDLSAREVLDRGVERIQSELGEEQEIRASLLEAMGRVYTNLAVYPEAQRLLENAFELKLAQGDHSAHSSETAHRLAILHSLRGDDQQAIARTETVLAAREKEHGPDHPLVADVLNTLGNALQGAGDIERSEAVRRRALEIRERAADVPEKAIAQSLHNLANSLFIQGRANEAEPLYRRAAEIEERLQGEDSHGLATTLHVLAMVNQGAGKFEQAIEDEERSLKIRERVLGPEHPHVALSLTTLGELYVATDRGAEAIPLQERAAAIARNSWGVRHGDARWAIRSLARSLHALGQTDRAISELDRLARETEEQVENHGSQVPTLSLLAGYLDAAGQQPRALGISQQIVAIEREVSGPDHPYLAEALHQLANRARDLGAASEARSAYREAFGIYQLAEGSEAALDALRQDAGTLLGDTDG